MHRTASSEPAAPVDPAHRFAAIARAVHEARQRGETYDLFDAMTESVLSALGPALSQDLPEDATDAQRSAADAQLLEDVRRGVKLASSTYDTPTARNLFDACLLAGASSDDLEEHFNVSVYETAAYSHLFFDRTVFPNAFHVVHYIAMQDPEEQDLLRIAQAQGFEAIVTQYGAAQPVTPEAALANVLAADAANYRRVRELPLTGAAAKDARALGKQVVATATAMQRVQDAKSAAVLRGKSASEKDFEIVPGPPNPTLSELLSAGGRIAVVEEESKT